MTLERHATVIGAGIVGVCCALYLQREGFRVRLIDRDEPGKATSFGNTGNFNVSACTPAALPGVLKAVPRMLFDPNAPLKVRWRHLPRMLPWFLRFIEAGRPARVEAIATARASLLSRLEEGFEPLIAEAGAGHLINRTGFITAYESERAFSESAYAFDLRRRHGVKMDMLDGNEAREIEPALSPSVVRAAFYPDVAHTVDPLRFTQALVQAFERRGGEFVRATVSGFEIGGDRLRRVRSDRGAFDVDQVVIAAGIWSRPLAAQLGTTVPLAAERGYHVMFANPGVKLRVSAFSADRYVGVTHMVEGIRATGIAEFDAPDAPPDRARARLVCRQVRAFIPGLKGEPTSEWMGPRPSHPDSLPVIGRAPRFANVVFAFGHDHNGLAMAGITGKLVGELVSGRPTSVDVTPFRPTRF